MGRESLLQCYSGLRMQLRKEDMNDYRMYRCSNCGLQMRNETEKYRVLLKDNLQNEQFDINVTIAGAFEYLFGIRQVSEKFLCQFCVSVLTDLYVSKRNVFRNSHASSLLFRISNENLLPTTRNNVSFSNNTRKMVSHKPEDGVGETILPCDDYEADIVQEHHSSTNNAKSSKEMRELFPILKIEQLKDKNVAFLTSNKAHFTCKICYRNFSAETLLKTHCESVHCLELKKYECSLCHKKFFCDWFLKNHIDFSHNGITIEFKFKCDKCEANLSSEIELKGHKLNVHDIRSRPFNCNLCKESFHVIPELRNHLIEFHENTKEAKIAAANITIHERYQPGSKFFKKMEKNLLLCPNCKMEFKNGKLRNNHVKLEHNGVYFCACCSEKFDCPVKWGNHQYKSSRQGNFSCEICNFNTTNMWKWNEHYKKHRDKFGPPQNVCDVCSKAFATKHVLKRHMEGHQNGNEFKCCECNKIFKYQSVLDEHQVTVHHKGDFSCDKCGRRFLKEQGFHSHQIWHLRVERRKHLGGDKKPVKIENDGELEVGQYYSIETLKFNCPLCLGSFTWKNNFIRHLRVFHNIKGYSDSKVPKTETPTIQCPHCRKLFGRKDMLRRHFLDVHKEKEKIQVFQCELCRQEFKPREYLRHVKQHRIILKSKSKEKSDKDLCSFYSQTTKTFLCECEKEFAKEDKFLSHFTSCHDYTVFRSEDRGKLNLEFKCTHCDKAYLTNSQLKEHVRNVRKKCYRIKRKQNEALKGQTTEGRNVLGVPKIPKKENELIHTSNKM